MSRRGLIQMTDDEVRSFLAAHRTAQVATMNPDGMPHLVAMWYGLLDGEVVMWTYAKSQKARNLRRSPKVALLVESGERYDELQGVSITGTVELSDVPEYVMRVGEVVFLAAQTGQAGNAGQDLDDFSREVIRKSADKRIALTVKPAKIVSWDHRKLGGGY